MIRTSESAQIETAVRMYVNEARTHDGTIVCMKADVFEKARRLIRLNYDPKGSCHLLPAEAAAYLQFAGFDPEKLCITDYEKFEAVLESFREKEARGTRYRKQQGREPNLISLR
jgi:hypothetical protein